MNKTDSILYRPVRSSIDLSGAGVEVKRRRAPKDLAPFVDEFWQYRVSPDLDSLPMQVFPSGCVSLRVNIMPGRTESFVYGPSTNNNMKSFFFQEWVVFGATLHPDRAYHLMGLPLAEMRDLRIQLSSIWPKRVRNLNDQMHSTSSFEERLNLLTTFLRSILRPDTEPSSDFLNTFQDMMRLSRKHEDISLTAKRHQISGRTMRRHFLQYLGLGPKQMDRIVRVQRTMRDLLASPNCSLADIATAHGFSDQPHLTREFRSIVGLSPKRFTTLLGNMHDKSLPEWGTLDPEWRCRENWSRIHRFE